MYANNCKALSTEIQGVGSNQLVSNGKKECVDIPCCHKTMVQAAINQSQEPKEIGIWEQPEIVSELVKLPRVLPFYAKSRQTLEQVMDYVEQNASDLTVQSLLNAHSTYSPKSFPFRGFCLINGEQKMRQIEQVDDLVQRPVWFLLSGMGVEQWRCGMAREMMKLDSFRCSMMRSCELLKPYGIPLMQLITGEQQDKQYVMTGVESYVYMTAIQIALVDCLRLIGIRADGMIGQSAGELVCAYIDQCLTHEQALMCSYYFANCLQQAQNLPQSLMAVVGDLTWDQLRSRCPSGVVPVCFDSVDQVVITGPVQLVRDLLRQLRLEGIYVREIEIPSAAAATTTTTTTTINAGQNSTGVFVQNFGLVHTQYLVDMLPLLRKCLETLNIVPRTRSSKWISTCCQPEQYSLGLYQTMSIDYLCKLFTTPVMLQQSLMQVPKSAILIEISPRSLMQTLLKKSLIQPTLMMTSTGWKTPTANMPTIIPLMPTTFGISGQFVLEHFLVQLGRLYLEGVEFDCVKLFVPFKLCPTVYPVPVEQKVLSLLSQWNIQPEQMSYIVSKQAIGNSVEQVIMNAINSMSINTDLQSVTFTVDVESLLEKESYLLNHQINGRVLYPTTGYLYLVWKALAQFRQQQQTVVGPICLDSVFGQACELEQLPPVCFENVQIHRATVLREQAQQVVIVPQNKRVLFKINYQPSTGLFEIVEGKNLIVNGKVYVPAGLDFVTPFKSQWESQVRCNLVVPQEQIYTQFKQCGYELIGEFQPIVRSNVTGTQGELLWTGKWIPFLDSMLHMNFLAQQKQQTIECQQKGGLVLPTRIRSVRINPIEHLIRAEKFVTLPVLHDLYTNKTVCGGIEITGIQMTPVVLPKDQFNPSIITETIANTYLPTINSTAFPLVENQPQSLGISQVKSTTAAATLPLVRPTFVNNWTIGQTCVLNSRLTHLIVGALDCDFGLELAQWMVQYCGVKYLVLTTQRVNTVEPVVLNAQQSQKLRYLQNEFGCQIKCVSTLDLNDETECLLLVRQACRMTSHFEAKIGSIFHLGGLFVEQPQQGMTFSVKSLSHLDKYTRNQTIMPDYGLFVVFNRSQMTTGVQTAAIQKMIEGVCESRRRECGRHALLVDWMVLIGTGEQVQVPVEYKKLIVRLEQMLVQSVRIQLPAELQQMPFFTLRVPEVQTVGVEQTSELVNKVRRQVQERPMILMAQKCVEQLNNVECVNGQLPLFVVMPIEGSVSYIRTWAQQLKVPVFGLQFTQECLRFETAEQLAQFYWQQIERVVPHVERVHLVGHTFGVPVAFEMASRRPQQVVSLCLLDSGLSQTFLNGFVFGVESVCEFDGLFRFYQQFVTPAVRLSVEQFYQMLAQIPTFDERVKFVVGKIVEQSQFSFDLVDLETAVRSYVRYMIISCKYVPCQPLRLNRIVVVRPNIVPTIKCQPWEMIFSQQETVDQEMVEKLFQGLRQYVNGRLQVHLIDGEQKNFFHGRECHKNCFNLEQLLGS